MIAKRLSLTEALAAARETRRLEIGTHILARTPQLFCDVCPGRTAIVVADASTLAAAGREVQRAFAENGVATRAPYLFRDPGLYAEHRFVEMLEGELRTHDAVPIAVGSGTINDLTKLAAHRTGRPSLCVATAASMDGYTAYGSSITYLGSKQTFDCPAPVAVLADLAVIRSAPPGMNAWGYADLSAKVTAGADWILADALDVEPIEPAVWNIAQGVLRDAIGDPEGVQAGNEDAIGGLVEGLMLGGFAMQAMRSSRCASGAEHQFSHLWDMQHHTHNGAAPSHGLKVGIGTLAITALYEALFALPLESLDLDACFATWPTEEEWQQRAGMHFKDEELKAVAVREMAAKACSREQLRQQLTALTTTWPAVKTKLRAQLLPFDELRRRLSAAGAATAPEEIGITRQRLRESFYSAFLIRRRFTVLDLAVRAGLLDACLEMIFSSTGRWPA
jgi:glycerol-1-phosphate dehydrogenase [NAD(P)+]